jgi:N utilization substance protein B
MKTQRDPRHQARILALQYLFSVHFDSEHTLPEGEVTDAMLSQTAESAEMTDYDGKLAGKLVNGVQGMIKDIDAYITEYAPQWPIEQIQKVDLEILRIALWEGFLSETTPPKVAIDEAIEIAKEFGGDASSKFINGVLGSIYEKEQKNGSGKN